MFVHLLLSTPQTLPQDTTQSQFQKTPAQPTQQAQITHAQRFILARLDAANAIVARVLPAKLAKMATKNSEMEPVKKPIRSPKTRNTLKTASQKPMIIALSAIQLQTSAKSASTINQDFKLQVKNVKGVSVKYCTDEEPNKAESGPNGTVAVIVFLAVGIPMAGFVALLIFLAWVICYCKKDESKTRSQPKRFVDGSLGHATPYSVPNQAKNSRGRGTFLQSNSSRDSEIPIAQVGVPVGDSSVQKPGGIMYPVNTGNSKRGR